MMLSCLYIYLNSQTFLVFICYQILAKLDEGDRVIRIPNGHSTAAQQFLAHLKTSINVVPDTTSTMLFAAILYQNQFTPDTLSIHYNAIMMENIGRDPETPAQLEWRTIYTYLSIGFF